jgi:hypothetical protein
MVSVNIGLKEVLDERKNMADFYHTGDGVANHQCSLLGISFGVLSLPA